MTTADPLTFRHRLSALGLGLVLLTLGWLAMVIPIAPKPLPADAPPGEFSAARAFAHLQVIARQTHPVGSSANATVSQYLVEQLTGLGCEVATQSFTCHGGEWRGLNVSARLAGAGTAHSPAGAVALVCHHDSVPTGPGASDDGVAVAALLETARALKAGPALRNDVILLFTDGEEVPGELAGAQAFVKSNAWWRDVGCVFNFDARGVSGPELMYETSAGNGPLIREFAHSTRRAAANSLMSEVYRHMPNSSDFTVFREAGRPGLNFAFIGGIEHYHQPSDDLEHVSMNTLQHTGTLALSLARHFGDVDLAGLRGKDAVYFDLLGRVLIRYPARWAMPLALAGAALYLIVVVRTVKRHEASGWKLAAAAATWGLILLLVVALFGYGHAWIFRQPHRAPVWLVHMQMWPYWFLALGLTLALSTALPTALGRWLGSVNLALGALWWWLWLALAGAWWMPGGSFVGLWPLLFGLLGIWWAPRLTTPTMGATACLAALAMPVLILIMPLLYGAYVALGPEAAVVPMAMLVLVVGSLWLQAAATAQAWKWTWPTTGLVVAALAVLGSFIWNG